MIVIDGFDVTHEPVQRTSLLLEIGNARGWFRSPEEGAEKSASWDKSFYSYLRRNLQDCISNGWPHTFDFNSSSDEYIQGSCFCEPNDSTELRAAKARRSGYAAYTEYLKTLNPREFEAVCKGLLDLIGCEPAILTRRGNDQGIDFFGRLSLEGRLAHAYHLGGMDKSMSAWLVGQAKHYKGSASTPELRELVGSVELARAGVFGDDGKALARLTMRPFDPVFYMFFTTGRISRDGWKLIKDGGLIGLEGPGVAAMLADHSVGLVDDKFDQNAAGAWVAQHLD